MRDPFTCLPAPMVLDPSNARPIAGQLAFPIFASPTEPSHVKACPCADCRTRVLALYGRTL